MEEAVPRKKKQYRTTKMTPRAKRHKRKVLLDRDGPFCTYCERPFTEELPPTFDHLIGLVYGGTDHISNLVLACWPCNNARANDSAWVPGQIPELASNRWRIGCMPNDVVIDGYGTSEPIEFPIE